MLFRRALIAIRRKISSALSGRRFLKNVMVISGGTALAQLIGLLSSPILARLYTPADFGVLAVYTSILGMIAVAQTLNYHYPIPVEEDDAVAINLLLVCLFAVVLISVVVLTLSLVTSDFIVRTLDAEPLKPYLWLLSLGILGGGVYQSLSYWALRRRAFSRIAVTNINKGLFGKGSQIGLGLLGVRPLGLLIGSMIGLTAGTGTLLKNLLKSDKHLIRSLSSVVMLKASVKYKSFPLIGIWSQFATVAGVQIPVLILSSLYGSEMVGSFSFATKIVAMPITLVGASVTQVFFGEAAGFASSNLRRLLFTVKRTASRLFAFGLIVAAILILFGPWLFSYVFGHVWREAGVYAQALSVMLALRVAVSPVASTLKILQRQGLHLFLAVLRLSLIIGSLYISSNLQLPPLFAVVAYSVCVSFVYILSYVLVIYAIKQRIKETAGKNKNTSNM